MTSLNIAQNQVQEFELITSCHFENQTSPKPTWSTHGTVSGVKFRQYI